MTRSAIQMLQTHRARFGELVSGARLTNIDDAIAFNNIHEGIHLGVILTRLKIR